MPHRVFNKELVEIQDSLRKDILDILSTYDGTNGEKALQLRDSIDSRFNVLIQGTIGAIDHTFFKQYQLLITSLFHVIQFGHRELSADSSADTSRRAAIATSSVLSFSSIKGLTEFNEEIQKIQHLIQSMSNIADCKAIVEALKRVSFPFIYYLDFDPYAHFDKRNPDQDSSGEDSEKSIPILSVSMLTEGEPWANPQILKPKLIYKVSGTISINYWPEGYKTLILRPITTFSTNLFEMSFVPIEKAEKQEFPIEGHVIFNAPQHSIDDLISIKLIGYYKADNLPRLDCPIIGYDQLLCKVLDPNSTRYPTGFKIMDKAINDIDLQLTKTVPGLDTDEKNSILTLLGGIINFQGFCAQQGYYKNVASLSEDQFRDHLIQHLIAQPQIGEDITKEASLGGGRVEIIYKGIIAELKVESVVSDRQKLLEKYGKQPVAYASAGSKQLSILCILDLTKKTKPTSVTRNNVFIHDQEVHGFENAAPDFPSKTIVVIIDGNTPTPSSYSK